MEIISIFFFVYTLYGIVMCLVYTAVYYAHVREGRPFNICKKKKHLTTHDKIAFEQ